MAVREAVILLFGVAIATAGIVGFTDVGPVDIQIQVEGETPAAEDQTTQVPDEKNTRSGGSAGETESSDVTPTETSMESPDQLDIGKIEFAIHNRINEIRQQRGLSRLKMAKKLRQAAEIHSTDMAQRGYFAHESPEGEGFQARYEQAGYSCRVDTGVGNEYATGAENIAYTWAYGEVNIDGGPDRSYNGNETKIAHGIVEWWMNSPGHRENILRDYWEYEGIGVATANVDGGVKVYATQNFC